MKRESFRSRLGFLLVSAGCAIGIGNVWRFPYVTGKNGGGRKTRTIQPAGTAFFYRKISI